MRGSVWLTWRRQVKGQEVNPEKQRGLEAGEMHLKDRDRKVERLRVK